MVLAKVKQPKDRALKERFSVSATIPEDVAALFDFIIVHIEN